MKLLFSDGNIQPVNTIQKTVVEASGEVLDAIILQFTGTTLSNVKSMFDDPTVLEQLTLYNDESEAVGDPFIGYINRVATSIVDESTGTYSVTLAKPTDLLSRVESLTKAVATLDRQVGAFDQQIQAYQNAHAETQNLITTLNDNLAGFQKALQSSEDTCRQASELYNAKANSIDQIEPMLDNIAQTYGIMQDALKNINNQYSRIAHDIAETKRAAGAAQSAADNARLNSDTCTSSSQTALSRMDEVTENYSNQAQKIQDVSKDLETTSKKTEEIGEALKTQTKTVDALDRKATQIGESVETLGTKTTEITNNVEELGTKTTEIKETVDSLIPETDITKMSLEDAKAYRVNESNAVLAEFLEAHPISSTCHKGIAATYSITKDKQTYLQAMILTTQMAAQSGVEYHPSWNATGQPCSYDWTLEELQKLAFQIESVVRPLVSAQQKIEATINACKTIEELQAVKIEYTMTTPVVPSVSQPKGPNTSGDTSTDTGTPEAGDETASE